jgi:cytoskeletal protein CcmA (bactofilin family)
MQIDGILEGDVRSVGLVIGERAEVHGEIWAEDVTVRGRVIGRIHARKVLLCSTCHVEGDILQEAFAVEAGAFFEGTCRRSENPLGEDTKKPASKQTAPQSSQNGLIALTSLQTT